MEICSIPAIALICYFGVEIVKRLSNGKYKKCYPLFSAAIGGSLGIMLFILEPEWMISKSVLGAFLIGISSGLTATGGNEVLQHLQRTAFDDTDMGKSRVFITGDKHREFSRLIKFCKSSKLRKNDLIILLGDAGFNYYGDSRDEKLKRKISALGVTLLCIHGNKEQRPQTISTYGVRSFHNGIVYCEPRFPNLLFAKDGEVYEFGEKKYMVIGGAHSVDRIRCQEEGLPFWNDEMPDEKLKNDIEKKLCDIKYQIDGFLTHTCPETYIPVEMFISTARANPGIAKHKKQKEYPIDVDRSTEKWLESIKCRFPSAKWYCGHYHVDKEIENIHMMYKEIAVFPDKSE